MWYNIIIITQWFGEMIERLQLISDFNKAARNAFISGKAPTLLESRITIGESSYKHAFSKFLGGGFRIKALSGQQLNQSDLVEIGKVILDNAELVRKLIALGWDTLEIHADGGYKGVKWPLKNYANIGGYLEK